MVPCCEIKSNKSNGIFITMPGPSASFFIMSPSSWIFRRPIMRWITHFHLYGYSVCCTRPPPLFFTRKDCLQVPAHSLRIPRSSVLDPKRRPLLVRRKGATYARKKNLHLFTLSFKLWTESPTYDNIAVLMQITWRQLIRKQQRTNRDL